jgi:hypothetical protein
MGGALACTDTLLGNSSGSSHMRLSISVTFNSLGRTENTIASFGGSGRLSIVGSVMYCVSEIHLWP